MWREDLARLSAGRTRSSHAAISRPGVTPSIAQILYLQRTAGNAAVTSMLESQEEEPTPLEAASADGGVGAEMEVGDALAENPEIDVPQAEVATDEESGEDLPISRCALPTLPSIAESGSIMVLRKAAPAHKKPPARAVALEFIPDEVVDSNGCPVGKIHVRVRGKEVAAFFARGGPGFRAKDPTNPKVGYGPTPAGTNRLGRPSAHYGKSWPASQIPWGTPIREVGDRIFYRGPKSGKWRDFKRLGITRKMIVAAEKFYGRDEALPKEWDLNDFGPTALQVGDSSIYLHTTALAEVQAEQGKPQMLSFSHGCIHIRPEDRYIMMDEGYLQAGVKLTVRKYSPKFAGPKFPKSCQTELVDVDK